MKNRQEKLDKLNQSQLMSLVMNNDSLACAFGDYCEGHETPFEFLFDKRDHLDALLWVSTPKASHCFNLSAAMASWAPDCDKRLAVSSGRHPKYITAAGEEREILCTYGNIIPRKFVLQQKSWAEELASFIENRVETIEASFTP